MKVFFYEKQTFFPTVVNSDSLDTFHTQTHIRSIPTCLFFSINVLIFSWSLPCGCCFLSPSSSTTLTRMLANSSEPHRNNYKHFWSSLFRRAAITSTSQTLKSRHSLCWAVWWPCWKAGWWVTEILKCFCCNCWCNKFPWF